MNVRSNPSTKSLNPYSNNENSFNDRTVWLPVHRVRETTSWIGWEILCHNKRNSDANGACSHVGKLLNLHLTRNGYISNGCPQKSMPELQSLVKTLRDSVKGTRHSTLNSHNSKRKPLKSAIDTQDPTLGAQTSVLNAQNSMLKLHELIEDSCEPNQRYSKLN